MSEIKEADAGRMEVSKDGLTTKYEITTYAGFYRGGKIYFASKVLKILEGTAIMTWELEGKDHEVTITPEDGDFHIPGGVPHIFYFPEMTKLIETFPTGTKTENYERYRKLKI